MDACFCVATIHTPVMLNEVMEHLWPEPGETILDATLGLAGHAEEILKRITPGGRLIGLDRDPESLEVARGRLKQYGAALEAVYANFADVDRVLENLGVSRIDGALFDLGLSSFQLDNPERGFSFLTDGPLDMRMDRNSYISAYDLLNNLTEEEISAILWNFGEERWHNRIARILVRERARHPIATTSELSSLVARAVPARFRYMRIHPATRTFQAVRIAVNRELEILEVALNKIVPLLSPSARIAVISFHSLEDRIVKVTFRKLAAQGILTLITPKPLTPGTMEVEANPSSRSAKLRVAERS